MNKNLNSIIEEFVKRFPAGRQASIIITELKLEEPNFDLILEAMNDVAEGRDSDANYRNEQDKTDAEILIKKLKAELD